METDGLDLQVIGTTTLLNYTTDVISTLLYGKTTLLSS